MIVGKYSNKLITDEDQCEDLIFIIQTLSHLTTKDYIDFGSQGNICTLHLQCTIYLVIFVRFKFCGFHSLLAHSR